MKQLHALRHSLPVQLTCCGLLLAIGGGLLLASATIDFGQADETQQRFEQNIEAIKKRIEKLNVSLDGVTVEKTTLQATVANLDEQISELRSIITQTKSEITRLSAEITQAEQDIDAQSEILEEILVLLYRRSGASVFELIMSADAFDDYLDDQEYLDRLKEGVTRSVQQIKALQAQLESDRTQQTKLLDDQQAQEVALEAVRREQNDLLTRTRNQERRFQTQLAQLQAEQERLEKELEEYIARLLRSRNSLGRVNAGDIIGRNGNTGWSTGPHLHLVIYSPNRTKYNPLTFIQQRKLVWPMGGGGGWVSQGYHAGHRALDIAAKEGTPLLALADGDIIHRGCLAFGNAKYNTFGVIIDHGEYLSLYIHLQAPNNPKYSDCNINRRGWSYGTKSIDYNVTE